MDIKEIFQVLQSGSVSEYFIAMSTIHASTKHYLLISEELCEEGVAYLQPLKEHRDAQDHLMRIFALCNPKISNKNPDRNEEEYIVDNVKKAFGHEYRAFFDTADWFTYICRRYIREELSFPSKRRKYKERYDDFAELQIFINSLPELIAKYREKKDVSNCSTVLSEVSKYKDTMEELLKYYKNVKSL